MNINRNNYEEYFINYMENELTAAERKAVEAFVEANPDLKNELELFESAKLIADEKIIFTNKNELFKKEETKIIAWKWNFNAWAIAAMLVLAVGTGWWMFQHSENSNQLSIKNEIPKIDSLINSKPEIQNQKEESLSIEKKSIAKRVVIRKIESIKINEHHDCIAEEIQPKLDSSYMRIMANVKLQNAKDSAEIIIANQDKIENNNKVIITEHTIVAVANKKSEEHVLASLPMKTNATQRQLIKALAWLGGKLSGNNSNDGNFNIDLGFAQINHKEALAKN
jgi:hypothetical protein